MKDDETVIAHALQLREPLLAHLSNVIEQVDLPAKMIAYCYGQKYAELVCTIIPSKHGLKLGFYRGVDLPDPAKLLEGNSKVSRYIEIKSAEQLHTPELKELIKAHSSRINNV